VIIDSLVSGYDAHLGESGEPKCRDLRRNTYAAGYVDCTWDAAQETGASAMMQNSAQPTIEPVAKLVEVGHDRAMPSMSIAMWVAIGAGLFGLAMTLLLFKRSAGRTDLGSVSEQWMAQHRAGRVDDPQH
jgi:hypothetical protein